MVTITNGAIPDALLTAATGSSRARLRIGTAARWAAARQGVHDRHGWWPKISGSADGYRPVAVQIRIFTERYTTTGPTSVDRVGKRWGGQHWYRRPGMASAAVPGTSNHGLARAVDVSGLGAAGSTRHAQWSAVARRHGFSDTEGSSIGEPWHWVDTLDPDTATITRPVTTTPTVTIPTAPAAPAPIALMEDDMPTLIASPSHGIALLDGGRVIGIGDQSTVDAWAAVGTKRVAITDADFDRLATSGDLGLLIFNDPAGWAHLVGGRLIGLDAAAAEQLRGKGVDTLYVSADQFARYAG